MTHVTRPVVALLELLLSGSQKHMSAVLESLPTASASRQPFGTETVSDALIAFIEKATESTRSTTMKMQVRPHLLYLPNQFAGGSSLHRLVPISLFCSVQTYVFLVIFSVQGKQLGKIISKHEFGKTSRVF